MNKPTDKWKPVLRGKPIPVDLETSYLHLRTSSAEGSGHLAYIPYTDDKWNPAGLIYIWFSYPVKYKLDYCQHGSQNFTSLPVEQDKHWVIEKRGYRTIMFCNGVQVLDVTASSLTCNDPYFAHAWHAVWGQEVGIIKFDPKYDTASYTYYTGKLINYLIISYEEGKETITSGYILTIY